MNVRWSGRVSSVGLAVLVLLAAAFTANGSKVAAAGARSTAGHLLAQGPGIFIPQPKGSDETLDSDTPAARRTTDTVTTLEGDRLAGHVMAIEAGGKLRLVGPQFHGEALVEAAALDSVNLRGTLTTAGEDEVLLVNGDRFIGRLLAITPESVVVESEATGAVKIARSMVRTISLAGGKNVFLESDFAQGSMDPWVTVQGSWSISDGALVCGERGYSTVAVELEQTEAITLEVVLAATDGRDLQCEVALFADHTEDRYGRNSIVARFGSYDYELRTVRNGSTRHVTSRPMGREQFRSGTIRFAYDPESHKAKMWVNTNMLGEFDVPEGPRTGEHVMLTSHNACRITSIRALRGVVPPATDQAVSDEETDVIQFGNKDRVSVTSVTVTDGTLIAGTPYGEISSPLEDVSNIIFRKAGRQEPTRQEGDVYVRTAKSRLTLKLEKLTGDYLQGSSDGYGDIKVLRGAIRSIRFNIYR